MGSTRGFKHSSNCINNNCQKISSRIGNGAKISENKVTIAFWKTEFSNATYGLNTLLTTKELKNDFSKKS